MTQSRSLFLSTALVAIGLSGCAKPGPLPTKEQAKAEQDGGTLYFGFDAAVVNPVSEELFAGQIDRTNSSGAWNGNFVPQAGAHIVLSVLRDNGQAVDRLKVSDDQTLIYQEEFSFDFIPFTFSIEGPTEVWFSKGDRFLFFCTVFNHFGNEFTAGDLLNESSARLKGVRKDINVQVTGLEPCSEARGGLCASHTPDGGIPTIQLEAYVADGGAINLTPGGLDAGQFTSMPQLSATIDAGAKPLPQASATIDAGR